jgi:hypothetical protein
LAAADLRLDAPSHAQDLRQTSQNLGNAEDSQFIDVRQALNGQCIEVIAAHRRDVRAAIEEDSGYFGGVRVTTGLACDDEHTHVNFLR